VSETILPMTSAHATQAAGPYQRSAAPPPAVPLRGLPPAHTSAGAYPPRPCGDRAASDVYRALTDPTRRAILDELSQRDGQTLFELPGTRPRV
jgi:hypothetical protein